MLLNRKQRPEFIGYMLYQGGFFKGIVQEAVESKRTKGKIYCRYVFNEDEVDYIYIPGDTKPNAQFAIYLEGETMLVEKVLQEPTEENWETAWIDLGGEG